MRASQCSYMSVVRYVESFKDQNLNIGFNCNVSLMFFLLWNNSDDKVTVHFTASSKSRFTAFSSVRLIKSLIYANTPVAAQQSK